MDIEEDLNEFCEECGTILDLPERGDLITCIQCHFQLKVSDYRTKEVVSEKAFQEKKAWLVEYQQKKAGTHTSRMEDHRSKVMQTCPECEHNEMYFFTLQLRGADEGSTVFYECVKCGHQIRQNN